MSVITESKSSSRWVWILSVCLMFICLSAPVLWSVEEKDGSSETGDVAPSNEAVAEKTKEEKLSSSKNETVSEGRMDVDLKESLLSVNAENANLVALLKKIAAVAGIEVEVSEEVSGEVTLFFSGLTLEEGVNRILEKTDSRNYSVTFVKGRNGLSEKLRMKKLSVEEKGHYDLSNDQESFEYKEEAISDGRVRVRLKNGEEIEYKKGEVVIGTLWGDKYQKKLDKFIETNNLTVIDYPRLYAVPKDTTVIEMIHQLMKNKHVTYAQPNAIGKAKASLSNNEIKEAFHMDKLDVEGERGKTKEEIVNERENDGKYLKVGKYDGKKINYVKDEIIIKFKENSDYEDVLVLSDKYGLVILDVLHKRNYYEILYNSTKSNYRNYFEIIDKCREERNVKHAYPNMWGFSMSVTDDPDVDNQWAIHNNEQIIEGQQGIYDADVDAPGGWGLYRTITRSPVAIAILDTGIDISLDNDGLMTSIHDEFEGRLWITVQAII